MTNVQAMSDMQLAMHLASLPERELLWRDFDHQVRDEYDRRILDREQAA